VKTASKVGSTKKIRVAMERCPKCKLENHAMAVISGQCAWCGYQATEKDLGKRGIWETRGLE
jgi:ribosomal protein L37E